MAKMIRKTKSAIGRLLHEAMDKAQWIRFRYHCPLVRAAADRLPADHCLYAVNVSERYRYVYIDNPKTGCSSLKSALVELELKGVRSDVDCYDWMVFHDRSRSPLKRLTDLGLAAPLSGLVAQGYRFVTFVRNPYTRLLSCYRDKILGNKEQKQEILARLGYPISDLERPIGFEDFVRTVVAQTDYDMNPHWRVQTAQTLFEVLDYSFIGRFENYRTDFEALFYHLGIAAEDMPAIRHLNLTREGEREGCKELFTEDLRDLVHWRYQKDFENFGYGPDLPD